MQMLFASTIFLLMTLASVSCLHCYTIANDVCSLSIWCANKESGFCSHKKTRLKGVRVLKPCVYRRFGRTPQGVRVLQGCGKAYPQKPLPLPPPQVGRGVPERWLC